MHEPLQKSDRLAVRRRDAMRLLGIGERLLAELTANGVLPSLKIGNARLYRVVDLERFLADRVTREGSVKS